MKRLIIITILGLLLLLQPSQISADEMWKVREYFQHVTDSVRVVYYLCWDSAATQLYVTPDSIVDSILVDEQCYNSATFKVYYPLLAPASFEKVYFPPLFAGYMTQIADSGYKKFTDGSNEDVFKADLTLLEAAVEAIRDTAQFLVTATGFSTFNPAVDSVIVKMGAFDAALDDDSTLADFLRASILAGGADSTTIADIIQYYVWRNIDTNHVDTSGLGEWLVNNLSGSSGLTVAQIVTGVWSETQSGYSTSGTFGYNLDLPISAVSGGSGPFILGIYTRDTSGTIDSVGGISVAIQDASGTPLTSPLITGTDGYVEFNVPNDSILIVARCGAAYLFDLTGLTVTGNDTITVDGYNFSLPPPGAANLANVKAHIYDFMGQPDSGLIVTAQRAIGDATDTTAVVIISKPVAVDTTDGTGLFLFELLRTSSYTNPLHGRYRIEGKNRAGQRQFLVDTLTVPEIGDVDLTEVIAARNQ